MDTGNGVPENRPGDVAKRIQDSHHDRREISYGPYPAATAKEKRRKRQPKKHGEDQSREPGAKLKCRGKPSAVGTKCEHGGIVNGKEPGGCLVSHVQGDGQAKRDPGPTEFAESRRVHSRNRWCIHRSTAEISLRAYGPSASKQVVFSDHPISRIARSPDLGLISAVSGQRFRLGQAPQDPGFQPARTQA
jgi:hypothetical protein